MSRRDPSRRGLGIGVGVGLLLAAVIGIGILPFLGLFDMSATGDRGLLDWWGNTNWESSLDWRAPDTDMPASANADAGLREYGEYCIHCHGAPDVSRAEWVSGMQPMPPRLWEEETQERPDGELFRIIDVGVRMTGMPPFGPNHDDQVIWNLVAAVRALDSLDPAQAEILRSAGAHHGGGEAGGGEGGHQHEEGAGG